MTHDKITQSITSKDRPALQDQKAVLDLVVHALQGSPDIAWLDSLVKGKVFEDAPLAEKQQDIKSGLELLQEWAKTFSADTDNSGSDYMKLFIGPGRLLAPPWESVFRSEDGLLFQAETLEVRAWFKAYGVESKMLYNEPDDHIALELEFASHLTGLALVALDAGDEGEATDLIDARATFLEKHPLQWVFNWCNLVEENAKGLFYKGIARIVSGVLRELAH